MTTHPIDPTKPRDGYLITITRSTGKSVVYAANETLAKAAQAAAWEDSRTKDVRITHVAE